MSEDLQPAEILNVNLQPRLLTPLLRQLKQSEQIFPYFRALATSSLRQKCVNQSERNRRF